MREIAELYQITRETHEEVKKQQYCIIVYGWQANNQKPNYKNLQYHKAKYPHTSNTYSYSIFDRHQRIMKKQTIKIFN